MFRKYTYIWYIIINETITTMKCYRLTVNNGKETKFTDTYALPSRDLMIGEMLKQYGKKFDDNYFPQENESGKIVEVKDCDGEITWTDGESYIGAGDKHAFFEEITAEEYEEEN